MARARFDRCRYSTTRPPLRETLRGTKWRLTIAHVAAPAAGDGAAPLLCWARSIVDDLCPRREGRRAEG